MDKIEETARGIKKLEIQGATSIAVKAVEALRDDLLSSDSQATAQHVLEEGVKKLIGTRETEPMMRNGLRYLQKNLSGKWKSFASFSEEAEKAAGEVLEFYHKARKNIVEIGSKRIRDGDTVFTHCHSSAVTETLIKAHESGKSFRVIQTETRPKYQGRITARELVEAGIETTMIVDSAARHFMKEIDFVLVGSDAVTSEGNVINKIGTSQVALAANEARIPFYVLCTLLKFDPVTIHGEFEAIEERGVEEIWDEPPEGLKLRNPAFDVTRRDYIHGIITEEGIISPHSILEAVHRHYPWILE